MADQKLLNQKIGSIKGQLTRFSDFVDNFNTTLDYAVLATRLDKVEQHFLNDFDNYQTQLELISGDSDTSDEARSDFEQKYYSAISKAKSILNSNLSAVTSSSQVPISPQTSTTNPIKLPPINIPQFDGSFDKYLQFYDTFKAIIHENKSLAPTQKFYYLLSSLKGEALQTIQAIQISDTNYFIAWKLVCEKYQNDRLIINSHIQSIFELSALNRESKDGLCNLVHTMQKNVRCLEALKQPVQSWDALLVYLVNSKLDNTTRREWESSIKGTNLPSYTELIDFLTKKCQTLEALSANNTSLSQKHDNQKSRGHTYLSSATSPTNPKCYFCKGTHWLNLCDKFLKLPVNERFSEIKKIYLCTNCLRPNHTNKDCKSGSCKKCQKRHHTLLHINNRVPERTDSGALVSSNFSLESKELSNENRQPVITSLSNETNNCYVILSTANVYVFDEHNNPILCRVLLDSGSQSNYITYNLAKKLNLKLNKINLPVSGISQNLINIKHSTTTSIKSIYNSFKSELNFLVIKRITDNLPNFSFNKNDINIPNNINLADSDFNQSKPIDLLLGANIFYSLLCIGQIKLGDNLPLLQKTHLGWVISGPLMLHTQPKNTICNLNVNENVQMQLEKFWKLEECSPNINTKFSREELECEKQFAITTTRDPEGKFIVSLPIKDNLCELGTSKENSIRRFYSLEKRLNKDPELKKQYCDFINEYISLNHMTVVNEHENVLSRNPTYYMPHHCVVKNSSTTTKVRVVFDASAKTSSGISLNDVLKVGPTIQDDLFSIILRFRTHNYVITSDIEKMYRMIYVTESDKNLQQIVWRSNPDEELKTYKLNTVTYGTASAPFLAIRSLHQVAYDNLEKYPEACNIILKDFYVDDLIFGTSSIDDAIKLKNQISSILASAGFVLRKWTSNAKSILQLDNNTKDLPQFFITDVNDKNVKTLGIFWEPNQDSLSYSVNLPELSTQKISKRFILGVIAQIFDPLGLLGPIIIRAKLILQELWKQQLGWDDSVPPNVHSLFIQFYRELCEINELQIPRHVLQKTPIKIELHAFCDASLLAYGACIYLVSEDVNGNRCSQLLTAKSRVAPIKTITLPRLELCGALLLVQLVKRVTTALNLSFSSIHFWTDSTIVLSWLRIEPSHLKTFVGNRISEIMSDSTIDNWNHVSSIDNPADIISRGTSPNSLIKSSLWWSGPHWLLMNSFNWPQQINLYENEVPELKQPKILTFFSVDNFTILTKYSSFMKLKRVVAYCLRFIKNSKTIKTNRNFGPLSVDELSASLKCVVYIAQMQDFFVEIHDLRKKGSINPKSRLISLDPFLDEGVIRVGGRLNNADAPYNQKHPYILCNKNPLTRLIIRFEHERLMHAGPQAVLASIRCEFWILNGRNVVKGVIRQCVRCFKAHPKIICPKMGDLPCSRVTANRPFTICGVDFAGPFLVKDGITRSRTLVKCYLCVFVCFTTKASHLELVSDMSLEAFLNALKRFISRRGIPNEIHSDNGSNFKGAANELDKVYKYVTNNNSNSANIQHFLQVNNIKWFFIPPRSPHFGGLWEACVKSAKFHLKRILSNTNLTFEQFYTIIVQIEAILNSRPITPLSDNIDDLEPLTPAHFLIGQMTTALPQKDLVRLPINRITNYQRLQQITQHFWSRWHQEYLSNLQQRVKWKTSSSPTQLKNGMMVLLKEDSSAPFQWHLGRIIETNPGKDGEVRVVTVKTAKGTFKRSFAKVCPLPVSL